MKMFYLQDGRSYLGNSIIWWSKEANGYTTDLQQAREFTYEEAMEQHRQRETDIPWPVEYIGERMQLSVDMQTVRRTHLLDHGIQLLPTKPVLKQVTNCGLCGQFIRAESQYGHLCRHCGQL
jgi:hypothetical protein